MPPPGALRRLVIVLGDQLNEDSAAFDGFDPRTDAVWMAEVRAESTHVPSHQARTALFLAAMRHFRESLRHRGIVVHYRELDRHLTSTLGAALAEDLPILRPTAVVGVRPGEYRLVAEINAAAGACGYAADWCEDRHFISSDAEFAAFARGRRELRQEYFYRQLRRRTQLLMDGAAPAGGDWNYDTANRAGFDGSGPGLLAPPRTFPPDGLTQGVLALVAEVFAGNPGSLAHFDWPVTRAEALLALDDFIEHRLPLFGRYQDAMWGGEVLLYHSRLSAALNLKLLSPLEVCRAAESAYRAGRAPIEAAEGFVRQILGWREYVRGIYWHAMPDYAESNALAAHAPLPSFYWTGETEFACLADTIARTLDHGYAHHIERLMVTGLFALLLGVEPRAVHEWYLGIYVDAVEWVELPNVLGMSQHADGGLMASKPYIASGRYLDRASDHCARCPRDPALATGVTACPFTTLYWDFLERHAARFERHPRMAQQVRNLTRKTDAERAEIRRTADTVRLRCATA